MDNDNKSIMETEPFEMEDENTNMKMKLNRGSNDNKKKILVYVLCGAILLILIVVAIYIIIGRKDNNDTPNDNSATKVETDNKDNNKTDNRIGNLRLATYTENSKNKNTKNKYGLTGLESKGKGFRSTFKIEGYQIHTKVKYDKKEAEEDNLITQRYLGYKHNEDQFYRLEELTEERIKEVIDWLDEKIEEKRNEVRKEIEYKYNFVEKDNLIGIITFNKDRIEKS